LAITKQFKIETGGHQEQQQKTDSQAKNISDSAPNHKSWEIQAPKQTTN
jgi:hypothetical protein